MRPDPAEISAYVDGELDPESAARLAYAAARDPAVAAEIAQLTKLKAAMADAVPEPSIADSATRGPDSAPVRPPLRARRGATVAAAGLAVALLAGLAGTALLPPPTPPGFAESAVAAHRAWSADVPASGGGAERRLVAGGRSLVAAPDLSAAQLALRTAEALEFAAGNVLHFGYVGTRGCRLSLFVSLDAVPSAAKIDMPGVRSAAWSKDGVAYLLIAEGMDETRFRTIAAALRTHSIDRAPLAPPAQEALAESRLHSGPCTA
jgi:anti-sigma factor RsiW